MALCECKLLNRSLGIMRRYIELRGYCLLHLVCVFRRDLNNFFFSSNSVIFSISKFSEKRIITLSRRSVLFFIITVPCSGHWDDIIDNFSQNKKRFYEYISWIFILENTYNKTLKKAAIRSPRLFHSMKLRIMLSRILDICNNTKKKHCHSYRRFASFVALIVTLTRFANSI